MTDNVSGQTQAFEDMVEQLIHLQFGLGLAPGLVRSRVATRFCGHGVSRVTSLRAPTASLRTAA